jgi:glutathione S-transferase
MVSLREETIMLELWSGVLSPFSAKVRIALAEKKIPVTIREIPWSRKTLWGPKPAEFLRVSPHGQVPVLVDGGAVIYDSTVICEYLEDRYPEPRLMPRDPAGRARCRQLEDEADRALQLGVTPLVRELFLKPDPKTRDGAQLSAAQALLATYYARLEGELEGRELLCGELSLADLATSVTLFFSTTLGAAIGPEQQRLQAWLTRMRTRPALASEAQAMTEAAAKA